MNGSTSHSRVQKCRERLGMLIAWASVFGSLPHPTWRTAVIWLLLQNVFRYSDRELSPDTCTLICSWKEKAGLQKSTAIGYVSPQRCSWVTEVCKQESLLCKPFMFEVTFSKRSLKFKYSDTYPGKGLHKTWKPRNGICILVTGDLSILRLCENHDQWNWTVITASRWHLKARIIFQTYNLITGWLV